MKNRIFNSLEDILYLLQKAFGTPKIIFQIKSEVAQVKQEAINAAMESEKELKRRKRLHHELNDYSKETINKEFKGKDYLIKEKFRKGECNPEYSGVYHVNEKSSRDVDFSLKKLLHLWGRRAHRSEL